jgi:hypothetical protein
MTALVGWLALGTGVAADVLVECETYTRLPFSTDRDIQSLPGITGVGGRIGETITHGAVYDKIVGGLCLARWAWAPPLVELPGSWPPLDVFVSFSLSVQYAINSTARRPDEVSGVSIDKGATLGWINGQPIVAISRLMVVGGLLLPRASFAKRNGTPTSVPVTA